MIQRDACCDQDHLRLLLTDQLPAAEQAQILGHLDGCSSCQHALEELAAAKSWWDELRQLPGSVECQALATASALHDATNPDSRGGRLEAGERIALDFLDPPRGPTELGRLGGFAIEAVLGRGGTGIVLKAHDLALNRAVAIKVLAPWFASSSAARQRFAREAKAAAAVVHEHVVTVHSVDSWRELPYLVMTYVHGRSLQERLDTQGPLTVEEVVRVGRQAAAGLAAAHAQGLVHRDVKPANILLEHGIERVLLTDFGLARAADDASLTQSGVIAGTPQYMAPEQARGEAIDSRADLFGLGSTLYASCTGQTPFRGESALAVLRQVCEVQPCSVRQLNPRVPEWLAAIIARLQAKAPADRFQSAAEVAELLGRCHAHLLQPETVPLPLVEPADRTRNPNKKRGVHWAMVAGLAVLGLSFGIASFPRGGPSKQDGHTPLAQGSGAPAAGDEEPLQQSLEDLGRRLALMEAELRQPARSRGENPLDQLLQDIRVRLTVLERDMGDPVSRK